jgi:hypothetical protein
VSANPSSKWYWNDWDNDRALQLCSFAAQGLWMRMLSIGAREGGYIRVGKVACTVEDIAAIVGHSVEEVATLLAELDARNVFSRTRSGCMYNRRQVRDVKIAAQRRANGKLGGNPAVLATIGKQTIKPEEVNHPLNPDVKSRARAPRLPYTLERKKGSPPYKSPPQICETNFAEWYAGYPHKIGRRKAETAYLAALARASPEQLADGLARYLTTKPHDIAWCNPATWLNQDRWLDQPQHTNGNGRGNGHDKPSAVDNLFEGAARAVQATIERDRLDENWRTGKPTAVPLLDRK